MRFFFPLSNLKIWSFVNSPSGRSRPHLPYARLIAFHCLSQLCAFQLNASSIFWTPIVRIPMKWSIVGEAAKATNSKVPEVSHRSYGDNYKKQETNVPSNDGWNAWRLKPYNGQWTGDYWNYEVTGAPGDANHEVAGSSYGRGSSDASWQVVAPNQVKPWPINCSRETTDDSSAESSPATSRSPSNLRTGHIERWESQEEIRIATLASRRSWADETSSVASSCRYYHSSSVSTTGDVIDIDALSEHAIHPDNWSAMSDERMWVMMFPRMSYHVRRSSGAPWLTLTPTPMDTYLHVGRLSTKIMLLLMSVASGAN